MTDDPIAFQLNRGIAAQRVLDDELVKDVFTALEADYTALWKSCKDNAMREEHWRGFNALSQIRSKLQRWVDAGKIARKQIEP